MKVQYGRVFEYNVHMYGYMYVVHIAHVQVSQTET